MRANRKNNSREDGLTYGVGVVVTMLAAVLVLIAGVTYARRPQNAQNSQSSSHPDWSMGNLSDQGRPDPGTQLLPASPGGKGGHEFWRIPNDNDELVVAEASYLKWQLPPGEEKYASVKGEDIKKLELEVVAISEQSKKDGDQLWGRIAGTKYDRMSSDWVQAHLKKDPSMDVHVQQQDLPPEWLPDSWQASVNIDGKDYNLSSAVPMPNSVGTPNGPVEADVVWVGNGWPADFMGRDVKGKVALMYSEVTPGGKDSYRTWGGGLDLAAKNGATLAVSILGIPGNATNFAQDNAPKGVPALVISSDEGLAIRQAIETGKHVKMKLNLNVSIHKDFKTETTWGMLPGMTDEKIIFLAHHDSNFDGAADNASGMAMMQYIAAHYAAMPKEQRKRTMVFMDTPLHHGGIVRGDAKNVGAHWLHDNVDKLFPHTVMAINCEHITETQFDRLGAGVMSSNTTVPHPFFVDGSEDFKNLVMNTFHEFGVAVYRLREPTPGGELGGTQFYKMFPSFHVIDRAFYHTTDDTPEWTPASGFEDVARAYLKILDTVNTWPTSKLWGDFKPTDQAGSGN